MPGDWMKDLDIIRSVLPATERILAKLTAYDETPFCEFDAERLESAARLIKDKLQRDCEEALEASEDEMNENMRRFGI